MLTASKFLVQKMLKMNFNVKQMQFFETIDFWVVV